MRDLTVLKAVAASLIVLGTSIPSSHAQAVFFGMMSEQNPTVYNSHPGEISEDKAREMFEGMDINKDGHVSKDEFSAGYGEYFPADDAKAAERRFKALDIKNDGKVTEDEFVANRNVHIDESGDTAALTPNGARGSDGE